MVKFNTGDTSTATAYYNMELLLSQITSFSSAMTDRTCVMTEYLRSHVQRSNLISNCHRLYCQSITAMSLPTRG
ncbi:hypothetical protein L208DRAFT_1415992, partial [Tricholoma matsutake]